MSRREGKGATDQEKVRKRESGGGRREVNASDTQTGSRKNSGGAAGEEEVPKGDVVTRV